MKIYLYKRYIDDVYGCMSKVQKGFVFNRVTKRLEFQEAQYKMDSNKSNTVKTLEVFKVMADSINKVLRWKFYMQDFHTDGKLPVLDLKVYLDHEDPENKITQFLQERS